MNLDVAQNGCIFTKVSFLLPLSIQIDSVSDFLLQLG